MSPQADLNGDIKGDCPSAISRQPHAGGVSIMTTEDVVIYLLACAVNGETPEQELISEVNPREILDFAKKHRISCCVAIALESAGIKNEETAKAIAHAMRRNALFENSLEEVTAKLDEAGIWYVPLKGIMLKKYYPKPFMREMVDHDILIDASRADDVKKIMEDLGFTTISFGIRHHDEYRKNPVLSYEMHTSLFVQQTGSKIYEYYRSRKDFSRMEDVYLYLVAHEHKHYYKRGTGLRSLLDIYLYLKKEALDWDYVKNEAVKLGIGEFEQNNRQLAVSLFERKKVADEHMLSYILSSGAGGTLTNLVANRMDKYGGGRMIYILKRCSVPVRTSDPNYQVFARLYPEFYKNKLLLPLLPFYRILRNPKKGRLKAELKALWHYRK